MKSGTQAAAMLQVDRSTIWAWDAGGKLGPMPVREEHAVPQLSTILREANHTG